MKHGYHVSMTLLVVSDPATSYLSLLERLPKTVTVVVGNTPEFLHANAPNADVILSDISGGSLETAFSLAHRVRWVHALSAGVDKILFPQLIESPVPLTNSRGVFKDALAEFAIAAILFFAKDLRRLVRQQEAGQWDQFDVQLIHGQTLGIIGYGEIGRATAKLAHALGMKVVAARRRASESDPLLDHLYRPDQLQEMLGVCDYVQVCAPLTPETRGMIGAAELNAMKPSAVIINVGRGPVIVEADLIAALRNHIHGAALDVYDQEPLAAGHPFYTLPNVLLSPHSADHAVGWTTWSMLKFLENFERFYTGRDLMNIVDKHAGY
jgi:phosphoglycerate dehydrogenase-like enzyme